MRFSAIILAFKEPEQVNILIEQLLREFGFDIDIFVHVSMGSESIIKDIFHSTQVVVLPKHLGHPSDKNHRGRIGSWADETLFLKMMYSFEYACTHSNAEYCLVLSGQDMIVKKGLKSFLIDNKDKIFMDGTISDKKQKARLLHKWPPVFKTQYKSKIHPFRIIRRMLLFLYSKGLKINMQKNYQLAKGLVICKNLYWMCLPQECLRYFVDFKNQNKELTDLFLKSMCPEESFFSTLLFNNEKYKNSLNWINETEYKSLTYYGRFSVSFPLIEKKDIELIDKSNCFFAKKFSVSHNADIVEYYIKRGN